MLRTREQLQEALDDNPVPISGSPKRARSSLAGAWTGTSPASRSTSPEHPLRGLNSRTNTSGGARHLQPRGHGSLVRHAGRVSGQTLVDDLLAAATDRRFHGLATKQFQQPQVLVVKAVEHLVTIVELQLGLRISLCFFACAVATLRSARAIAVSTCRAPASPIRSIARRLGPKSKLCFLIERRYSG